MIIYIPTSSGSFIKFQRSASVSLFNSGKNFSGTAQPKRYIFSAVVFHLKVGLDPEPVSHYHNQYGTKLEIQSSATQIEICNLNINKTTSLHCPSKIRVQTMHMAWLLSRRLCFFRWSSSIRSRKLSLKWKTDLILNTVSVEAKSNLGAVFVLRLLPVFTWILSFIDLRSDGFPSEMVKSILQKNTILLFHKAMV